VVKGQCEKEDSANVAKIFDVRGSLARRRAIGAPSPENIAAQIKRWKKLLA
jgi:argininosuccinate lyase